jgi:hypothetical protein
MPTHGGLWVLARLAGIAHIPRAADSLASESLRSPSRAKRLALSAAYMSMPTHGGLWVLARLAGIEPTTLGFGGQYSIH